MLRSCSARQQFRGVESFEINDARALDQREQQVRHLRQHVKERQHAEQGVAGADIDPVEDGFDLAKDVGVSEHHAFGIGGCTRRIEQRSEIVAVGRNRLEVAGAALENFRQIAEEFSIGRSAVLHAVRIHQDDA